MPVSVLRVPPLSPNPELRSDPLWHLRRSTAGSDSGIFHAADQLRGCARAGPLTCPSGRPPRHRCFTQLGDCHATGGDLGHGRRRPSMAHFRRARSSARGVPRGSCDTTFPRELVERLLNTRPPNGAATPSPAKRTPPTSVPRCGRSSSPTSLPVLTQDDACWISAAAAEPRSWRWRSCCRTPKSLVSS